MKKTLLFVVCTCLISWLFAGIFSLFFTGNLLGYGYKLFGVFYMLIPAAVAVVLQKFVYKEKVVKPFLISFRFNKWFLVALFTPLVLSILAVFTNLLLPDVHFTLRGEGMIERYTGILPDDQLEAMRIQLAEFSPILMFLLSLVQGLIAACTVNALAAFGEELGWRGYMLHHMKNLSYAKYSLLTGIVWGFWHFPLILMGHNYPEHRIAGVFFMVIFCVLLSFLMTYIVVKSRSVISAAIFHGCINAFAGLSMLYTVGGNDLSNGIVGYTGFIAIAIVILLFFVYDKYISKENIFSKKLKDVMIDQ